jgi:hypothetical protein
MIKLAGSLKPPLRIVPVSIVGTFPPAVKNKSSSYNDIAANAGGFLILGSGCR